MFRIPIVFIVEKYKKKKKIQEIKVKELEFDEKMLTVRIDDKN